MVAAAELVQTPGRGWRWRVVDGDDLVDAGSVFHATAEAAETAAAEVLGSAWPGTPASGFATVPDIEEASWHYLGEPGEPELENGWQIGSIAVQSSPTVVLLTVPPAFRFRDDGTVEMQAIVAEGTPGSTVFTLPEAYRPAHLTFIDIVGAIDSTMSAGIVTIDTIGRVKGFRMGSHHETLLINGYYSTDPVGS